MSDHDIIEANYRRTLLRQLHGQLKEVQRQKSGALLIFARDVTFTLRLVDQTTTTFKVLKGATLGLDPGRSKRVARRRDDVEY
jgi:hypothetical protein